MRRQRSSSFTRKDGSGPQASTTKALCEVLNKLAKALFDMEAAPRPRLARKARATRAPRSFAETSLLTRGTVPGA